MSIDFVSKANDDVPRSFLTPFGSLFLWPILWHFFQ